MFKPLSSSLLVVWLSRNPVLVDRWLKRAIAVGILLRFALVLLTYGTNDTFYLGLYAQRVLDVGLIRAYAGDYGNFGFPNQPPLEVGLTAVLLWISQTVGIPFRIILRLPVLAADVWILRLVFVHWMPKSRRAGLSAAAAYSLAPVAILTSSYHGNVDSIYGAALLWAALLVGRRKGFLGGMAFALAFNIKLIPLVAGPALLVAAVRRRQGSLFVAGAGIGLLGFLPLIRHPSLLMSNILGYEPKSAQWGLAALSEIIDGGGSWQDGITKVQAVIVPLTALIVLSGILVAIQRGLDDRDALRLIIWSAGVFLVISSTTAPQHLALLAPVLIACDIRWGLAWMSVASVFVISVYWAYLDWSVQPFASRFDGPLPTSVVVAGLVAWLATAVVAVSVGLRPRIDGSRSSSRESLPV